MHQKRKRLDKPDGDTLKQIDDRLAWLVESMKENYIKPDEFTAEMAYDKVIDAGLKCTLEAMRSRLARLQNTGALSKRSVLLDGKSTNVYLRVKGVSADI